MSRFWIHALRAFSLATAVTILAIVSGHALAADDSHTIIQRSRAFHPGEVTINHGETLTFANRDEFIHQIYVKSDAMSFDSDEQPPGQDVPVKFSAAGTFEVHCHIHPKMALTVRVK